MVLVYFLAYLGLLQTKAIWPFTIDDMYITLRYAQHWHEGYGLVWNYFEQPVEGYSNFTFVVLARVALSLGLDPVVVLKSSGVLGLGFTGLGVYVLSRLWLPVSWSLTACILLFSYQGQIIWSVSGLETCVYEACLVGAVYFICSAQASKTRWLLSGFIMAILGLTRPEGLILIALFWLLLSVYSFRSIAKFLNLTYQNTDVIGCANLNGQKALTIWLIPILGLFVPWFLWRWHYFGYFFPNPVYCKGWQNSANYTSANYTLAWTYLKLAWPFYLLSLPAMMRWRQASWHFLWMPSVVYLFLFAHADPIVAFENRFFLPVFALLVPLSLVGLNLTLKQAWLRWCLIGFIWLLVIPKMSLADYRYFAINPQSGEALRHQVVQWIEQHTQPDEAIVLADCGYVPYYTSRIFRDSYCLNDLKTAHTQHQDKYTWFCQQVLISKPSVVILTSLVKDNQIHYTPADLCLAKKPQFATDYRMVKRLYVINNKDRYQYEIFKKKSTPERGHPKSSEGY